MKELAPDNDRGIGYDSLGVTDMQALSSPVTNRDISKRPSLELWVGVVVSNRSPTSQLTTLCQNLETKYQQVA